MTRLRLLLGRESRARADCGRRLRAGGARAATSTPPGRARWAAWSTRTDACSGYDGLVVADASVMPTIPRANTNLTHGRDRRADRRDGLSAVASRLVSDPRRRRDADTGSRARGVRLTARRPGRRARRPGPGEALVRVHALRGLPHRPLHRLGRRPDRVRAVRARARGRGRRGGGGRRSQARPARRPRGDALRTGVRRVRPLSSTRARTAASRSATGRGRATSPDGTTRPVPWRRATAALHGHVDVRRGDGDAGDRAREDQPGGAVRRARGRSPAASRRGSAQRSTRRRCSRERAWQCSAAASSGSAA